MLLSTLVTLVSGPEPLIARAASVIEAGEEALFELVDEVIEGSMLRAPTADPQPTAGQPATYVVKAGDTAYSIARRNGISLDVLARANGLADPGHIREGQTLILPRPSGGAVATGGVTLQAARVEQMVAIKIPSSDGPAGGLAWPIALQAPRAVITTPYRDGHRGIDIAAPTGTPIKAAAAGLVMSTERSDGDYGWKLVVDHGDGMTTWYAHLSEFSVAAGDQVRRGQTIGLVGSTGRSTGPHLHFELRQDNVPVNPTRMLQ